MRGTLSDIYKWKRSILREQYEFILSVKCFSICQLLQSFKELPCVYIFNVIPTVCVLTQNVYVWWVSGGLEILVCTFAFPVHILCQFPPLGPSYRLHWPLSDDTVSCISLRGKLGFFPPLRLRLRSFDERFLLIRKFQRATSNRRLSWSWDSLDIKCLNSAPAS